MIKIIALLKRKEGMSKAEFREYYETNHIPLCCKPLAGIAVDYSRNYIEDAFGAGDGDKFADGDAPALDYDVVTEVWFKNREDLQKVLTSMEDPAMEELIVKDELNLFDRSKHRFMICENVGTNPALLR